MKPPHSLWWATLDHPVTPRASLRRDIDVDVAIVGGGFTGLWTARELKRRDPALRIAVLEKSVCGFGASGRNGGWASALFPIKNDVVVARSGLDAFTHQRHVLEGAVRDLGEAVEEDRIDARFIQGGTLTFARSELQSSRLKDEVRASHELGLSDNDVRWLEVSELYDYGYVRGAHGAMYSPHCARINPARLVRGLSDVDEDLGVAIYENTAVTRIRAGNNVRRPQVLTIGGTVTADFVVRATEAFTPTLPGERRTLAPIYSLMIATDPLSASFWDETGFRDYATFTDGRHLTIYGQRTSDNRIAFGGRGAPYHFGSTVEERFEENPKAFHVIERTLRELFPTLEGSITHQWGGPVGMTRDLSPSVLVDFETGLASAGGYTGDGVVLSRVCAIAIADLLTSPSTETAHTRLPFVQHQGRRWEFEPLRWLGINMGIGLATWADHSERRGNRESRAAEWLHRLRQ
jgi:glycine/D-amino acid oxidase-like deaminating enzyme